MADAGLLAAALAKAHPNEAAGLLEESSPEETAEFLGSLAPETGAAVLAGMSPAHAVAGLTRLPQPAALELLDRMPPSAVAGLLRRLPGARRKALFDAMRRARQVQVGLTLYQSQLSVGARMDSAAATVRSAASAGAAKQRLQKTPAGATHLFVTDDDHRLVGRIAVSDILAADDDAPIARLLEEGVPALRASQDLETALSSPGWTACDELPVVDRRGRFVGSIRYSALRQAAAAVDRPQVDAGIQRADGSLMDIADLWYMGLARLMDSVIGRHARASRRKAGERT